MATESYIELNRTFHEFNITADCEEDTESHDFYSSFSLLHGEATSWDDLLEKYRAIILAEAGVGKTFEIRQATRRLRREGNAAFFLRLEYISDDFEGSFEEGDVAEFNEWLDSNREGWVLLDSVDEAKLKDARDFEKAIRRISSRLNHALSRTHIFVTSRISAWRAKTDLKLCNDLMSFSVASIKENSSKNQIDEENGLSIHVDSSAGISKTDEESVKFSIYSLDDLSRAQIETFVNAKGIIDTGEFLSGVERFDAWKYTSRPQDLEELIEFWRRNKRIGSHLELMEHSVQRRLTETDQSRADSENISLNMLKDGVQKVAAAATFSNRSSISVLDGGYQKGINIREVLQDWTDSQCQSLLSRPIFDDGSYGTVRFHHRSVREFLTARWIQDLIHHNDDIKFIENLTFRKKYGVTVITPAMRPILSWLIIFNRTILTKALKIDPQIIFECGDPSLLPIDVRSRVLQEVCEKMSSERLDSATSYAAVQKFSNSDLSGCVKALLVKHNEDNEVLSFLMRIIWQGNLKELFYEAKSVAKNNLSEKFSRIVAIRAVIEMGDSSDVLDILKSLRGSSRIDRDVLSEVVDGLSASKEAIDMLFDLLNFADDKSKNRDDGLSQSLTGLVSRSPDNVLAYYLDKAMPYLYMEPLIERRYCEISAQYFWLMDSCLSAVKRQLIEKLPSAISNASLHVLANVHALKHDYDYELRDKLDDFPRLIEQWPEMNAALFWKAVQIARSAIHRINGNRLTDFWSASIHGKFWSFSGKDFFPMLVEIENRKHLDDKLVALSVAFQLYQENKSPRKWASSLKDVVEKQREPELQNRLNSLLSPPPISEEEGRWKRKESYWKRREEARKRAEKKNLEKSIKWMSENINLVFNESNLGEGEIIDAHVYLLNRLRKNDNSRFWSSADWQSLVPMFGFQVAEAFKNAAVYFWRYHRPEIKSEKSQDDNSTSYKTIFGLVGLEIESKNNSWVDKLTKKDAELACRYAVCELNGFPSWFPALYEKFPDVVTGFLIQEVLWEIDNTEGELGIHYIIGDIYSHGKYLWGGISADVVFVLEKKSINNSRILEYLVNIIQSSSNISDDKIKEIARDKCSNSTALSCKAIWFSVWFGVEPKAAMRDLSKGLKKLNDEDSANLAMLVITYLVPSRHDRSLKIRGKFKVPVYLQNLHLLMCKYIHPKEDIDRSNGGVYSPTLRDDAQSARDGLITILKDVPGKESYCALKKIAKRHPSENARMWIKDAAKRKVENEVDIPAWSIDEFSRFSKKHENGDNWLTMHNISHQEKKLGYVFGVLFILIILGFSVFYPNPTPTQYAMFRTVLALAAAGVGGIFSGFIKLEGTFQNASIRAGGALALFVVVYFFNPSSPI